MVVSADAGSAIRRDVHSGLRPLPEFLALEHDYGVHLLDWNAVRVRPGRSAGRSVRHAAGALRAAGNADAVFSDGEHVGIPLGIAMKTLGPSRPHVVLGHHLTSRSKPLLLRGLRHMGISRLLVHSRTQLEIAVKRLGFARHSAAFVPYYADASFWRPERPAAEPLIVSAGREHRDYASFAAALNGLALRGVIAAGSLYSPSAPCLVPQVMPSNISVGMHNHVQLRQLYAAAEIVVVPLIPNDFQAGVTTLLEAMSMAKPVIVSATEGLRDVIAEGETGILVPPLDPGALRDAILRLHSNPAERRRLGDNARAAVVEHFDLPIYTAAIYRHLCEVARPAVQIA